MIHRTCLARRTQSRYTANKEPFFFSEEGEGDLFIWERRRREGDPLFLEEGLFFGGRFFFVGDRPFLLEGEGGPFHSEEERGTFFWEE